MFDLLGCHVWPYLELSCMTINMCFDFIGGLVAQLDVLLEVNGRLKRYSFMIPSAFILKTFFTSAA